MNLKSWCRTVAAAVSILSAATAEAKSYKSGELETKSRFGFGAFEARIRCARGPVVVSTFFLWRPGSETSPTVPWHEIDFEMGVAAGDFQTQVMTPGTSPPQYRKEHVKNHDLPTAPWDAYYTYRIEWTPDYIAFFIDGKEIRRETDHVEFAELFHQDASGDTPTDERMEVRTGVWPGASNIAGWSGVFDGSSVPTAHFVDYVKVWKYTPNQANKFSTLLLDESFNSLNYNNWYPAEWTFDPSASDYTSKNLGAKNGRLVVALTTEAGQGILPDPPADVPPPPAPTVTPTGFLIEAESYSDFYDKTAGNSGSAACSKTDVDVEPTADPTGGTCNVGWTDPGEWLSYSFDAAENDTFDITVRLASISTSPALHVELDGTNISGPLHGAGSGWQSFTDAVIPDVPISAGPHSLRVVFDNGQMNVNYIAFDRIDDSAPVCPASCDDANPCTTDACADGVCTHSNNTSSCADDGNACTDDMCAAGVCTHPSKAGCGTSTDPCAGLCSTPTTFAGPRFSSGNLGTGAVCYATTAALTGGVCGNLASGRRLTVNGSSMSTSGNWALPAKRNGGYCIQTTPGNYSWAYFVTW